MDKAVCIHSIHQTEGQIYTHTHIQAHTHVHAHRLHTRGGVNQNLSCMLNKVLKIYIPYRSTGIPYAFNNSSTWGNQNLLLCFLRILTIFIPHCEIALTKFKATCLRTMCSLIKWIIQSQETKQSFEDLLKPKVIKHSGIKCQLIDKSNCDRISSNTRCSGHSSTALLFT